MYSLIYGLTLYSVTKLFVAGINLLSVYCGLAGALPVPFHKNNSILLPVCAASAIVIICGLRAKILILYSLNFDLIFGLIVAQHPIRIYLLKRPVKF